MFGPMKKKIEEPIHRSSPTPRRLQEAPEDLLRLPEASPQPDVPESTAKEVHQVRQRRHPHSDEPPDSRIAPVSPMLKR
ncbi:hypothetical protein L596_030335 [Steinernema carpocapsae]|uniref:Uncharacterized protein n=1 Tax=Steinernema carpocapsae TaxID=34508 RepID=A0A4U5LP28_STECR|nr:hypothetical protein L596_030335 [Steinernema carpocapsae]